jgi:hypothetical protein
MRANGSEVSYSKIICTYGYSLISLIPAVIISSLQIEYLNTLILILSVTLSATLIISTFWEEIGKFEKNKKYLSLGLIILFQVILFLSVKFYFIVMLN